MLGAWSSVTLMLPLSAALYLCECEREINTAYVSYMSVTEQLILSSATNALKSMNYYYNP